MKLVGVDRRARDARAALNRLYHEVTYAVEAGRPQDAATLDVAGCAGIVVNILKLLAEALPEAPANELEALVFGPERDQFVRNLQFMDTYYSVPR